MSDLEKAEEYFNNKCLHTYAANREELNMQ